MGSTKDVPTSKATLSSTLHLPYGRKPNADIEACRVCPKVARRKPPVGVAITVCSVAAKSMLDLANKAIAPTRHEESTCMSAPANTCGSHLMSCGENASGVDGLGNCGGEMNEPIGACAPKPKPPLISKLFCPNNCGELRKTRKNVGKMKCRLRCTCEFTRQRAAALRNRFRCHQFPTLKGVRSRFPLVALHQHLLPWLPSKNACRCVTIQ